MPASAERSRQLHRRLWGALTALLVLGLGAGYCAVASLGPLAARAAWLPASDLAEYTAVMHVHSSPSHDGQGSVEEVPPIGDALVRLLRDGVVVHEATGATPLTVPLPGPGVSRVEVDLRVDLFPIGGVGYRPWIFSNPAHVRA
jgi:hypothetical protein